MKALILAAGYATRLYPLTKEYPKPLLKVGSRHLIDHIIDKLDILSQIDEIIVITNSKFIAFFRKWGRNLRIKKKLSLVDDLTKTLDDRLGAVGDINFAVNKKHIKDDLLVIGGDNLFDSGLGGFLNFAAKIKDNPVIGAYDIKDESKAHRYGVLKIDKKNKIIDFQEKPPQPKSTLIAMCLYYFPKNKLGLIREYLSGTNKYDATGYYIDWLRKKAPVYAYIFGGRWYDIGDPQVYNEAKRKFH